jgi:hypothetical protein
MLDAVRFLHTTIMADVTFAEIPKGLLAQSKLLLSIDVTSVPR